MGFAVDNCFPSWLFHVPSMVSELGLGFLLVTMQYMHCNLNLLVQTLRVFVVQWLGHSIRTWLVQIKYNRSAGFQGQGYQIIPDNRFHVIAGSHVRKMAQACCWSGERAEK